MAILSRVNTVTTGLAGTPWFSSIWFKDGDIGHLQASGAVVAFWTAAKALMAPGLSIAVQSDVQLVDTGTGQVVSTQSHPQSVLASGGGGSALPPATQGLIRLNTGVWVAGRQIRGHLYIPGMVASTSDASGKMTTSSAGVLTNAARAMTTTAGNPTQVVYSRKHRQAYDVVETPAQNKFAVLRSRRD